LLGLELAPGAKVTIDRSATAAASPHSRAQEGRVEVRDMQFLKTGNSLQVSGIDGHVVIDNNRFNLEVPDFGFSGARLARQTGGSMVLTRNEFVVGSNCPQKCAGLRAQDVSSLVLQANKFFVYGKYANAFEAVGVSVSFKENEFRGSGLYSPLIQIASSPTRFSTVLASSNVIDANGATAVQLLGETFASFTDNKFSGNGALNDAAGLDLSARGGLVDNPLLTNEGLHDKNVSTAVDFDGNGCRDIPSEANERLSDGSCRVAGKPKPSFP
jgi:hypothetical protein